MRSEAIIGSNLKWCGSAITLVLISLPVAAHHSAAFYDQDCEISLRGSVTQFKWANPHIYIEVETKNAAGDSIEWVVETLPPSGLRREGWSSRSLVPGDQVIIVANPARNPHRMMALGHSVVKEDGTLLVNNLATWLHGEFSMQKKLIKIKFPVLYTLFSSTFTTTKETP